MLGPTTALTSQQKITIELSRVGLFVLVLLVGLFSFLFQPRFINWNVLSSMYLGVGLSLAFHLVYVIKLEKFYEMSRWLLFSFFADSIFISVLIYSSGQNQSLFLFLHLANIMLSGLLFQSRGAYMVALFTSFSFTVASMFSAELKGINYAFLLILNNVAFFLVAGLSGYLSDQLHITGKKLAATGEKLKNLSELNEAIVENSPVAILTFDPQGGIFHSNPESAKILGLSGANANIFSVLGPLELPRLGQTLKKSLRLKLAAQENHKDIEIMIRPLSSGDTQYLALVEDRTELNLLEERARQNEKLAAIGGLAAGIAHEIRNPLAGISGSIEMLSQTAQNEDDQKLMRIILREIDRLNNLITEFLDYAKPEKNPAEDVDITRLLNDVIAMTKQSAMISPTWDVSIAEDLGIKGDQNKLKQAFLNILINAQQAISEKSDGRLTVHAAKVDSGILVRITDNGCGMSEETQKRIFEPFFTTKSKGTGLGLAMTYKILQSHHVKLTVQSEKDVGTTFEMGFPPAEG